MTEALIERELKDSLGLGITSLRQHLEGAPHPGLMLGNPEAWAKQYKRWYARAQELLK